MLDSTIVDHAMVFVLMCSSPFTESRRLWMQKQMSVTGSYAWQSLASKPCITHLPC